jgi:hypothetical protein
VYETRMCPYAHAVTGCQCLKWVNRDRVEPATSPLMFPMLPKAEVRAMKYTIDMQDAVSSRTCSASQRNETVKQAHRGTWLRKSWQVAFSSSTIF